MRRPTQCRPDPHACPGTCVGSRRSSEALSPADCRRASPCPTSPRSAHCWVVPVADRVGVAVARRLTRYSSPLGPPSVLVSGQHCDAEAPLRPKPPLAAASTRAGSRGRHRPLPPLYAGSPGMGKIQVHPSGCSESRARYGVTPRDGRRLGEPGAVRNTTISGRPRPQRADANPRGNLLPDGPESTGQAYGALLEVLRPARGADGSGAEANPPQGGKKFGRQPNRGRLVAGRPPTPRTPAV